MTMRSVATGTGDHGEPGVQRHPVALRGAIGQWAATAAGAGRVVADDPDGFFADGTRVELGRLSVSAVRIAPHRFEATPGMVDVLDFVHLESGVATLHCGDAVRRVPPGTLACSRPAEGDVRVVGTTSEGLRITVPSDAFGPAVRSRARLPLLEVDPACVGLLTGAARSLLTGPLPRPGATAAAIEQAIVGILSGMLEDAIAEPAGARGDASLLLQAQELIASASWDPGMSPDSIAASLGVSRRRLFAVFEPLGVSVLGAIRSARLAAVDRALQAGSTERASVLARRCGFVSADQLRRAFQGAYGGSVEERRQQLRALGDQVR